MCGSGRPVPTWSYGGRGRHEGGEPQRTAGRPPSGGGPHSVSVPIWSPMRHKPMSLPAVDCCLLSPSCKVFQSHEKRPFHTQRSPPVKLFQSLLTLLFFFGFGAKYIWESSLQEQGPNRSPHPTKHVFLSCLSFAKCGGECWHCLACSQIPKNKI